MVKFPSASLLNLMGLIGSSFATIHFSRRCGGNMDLGAVDDGLYGS